MNAVKADPAGQPMEIGVSSGSVGCATAVRVAGPKTFPVVDRIYPVDRAATASRFRLGRRS